MDEWYVACGKEKKGPFTFAQLQALARQKTLRGTDMVHQAGTQRWVAARDVPGLLSGATPEVSSSPAPTTSKSLARMNWKWLATGSGVLVSVLVVVWMVAGQLAEKAPPEKVNSEEKVLEKEAGPLPVTVPQQDPATLPGPMDVPSFLVTTNTKQVYRFHFSGLQSTDALRLGQQLAPFVAKLPTENPLRRAILQAKDVASFADDYRSLRSSFLAAGIDTIYFIAENHWIEATTVPGYVVIPGTKATLAGLQKQLEATGQADWARFLTLRVGKTGTGFYDVEGHPGWMVCTQGSVKEAEPSEEQKRRANLVEHALRGSCPIQAASVSTRILPELEVKLNDATPLTVVNLEKNKLDEVLSLLLPALIPAATRTTQLLARAEATTVSASAHPFPFVRQVAHMGNVNDARALTNEIQKSINGAVQTVMDMDADIGPLLGLFAKSMVFVSTQGKDVVLVLKPPVLFDMEKAQRTAREAQEQDWSALPAPAGYHWELVGALGTTSRNDVLARVAGVRVRGTGGPPSRQPRRLTASPRFVSPSRISSSASASIRAGT